MEFIDIQRLRPELTGDTILPFSVLRTLPMVFVDENLQIIVSEENERNLKKTQNAGSRLARVLKQSTLPSHEGRASFPSRILLEVTTACNLSCKMCPREKLTRSKSEHLSFESCKRVLDEANTFGLDGIWLYHIGEPFLHPEFLKILEYASNLDGLGQRWVSTNGHFLNDKNIEAILNSKLDYLNVSLNAASSGVYDQIIPQKNFEKVIFQFSRLVAEKERRCQKKPFIRVQMVEQELTKHEVDDFIRQHYQHADIVSINMLEHLTVPGNEFGATQRQRRPRGHCKRIARGDCIICSNGAVIPCDEACDGTRAVIGEVLLGSICELPLQAIWQGGARQKLLALEESGRMTDLPLCATCMDYDF